MKQLFTPLSRILLHLALFFLIGAIGIQTLFFVSLQLLEYRLFIGISGLGLTAVIWFSFFENSFFLKKGHESALVFLLLGPLFFICMYYPHWVLSFGEWFVRFFNASVSDESIAFKIDNLIAPMIVMYSISLAIGWSALCLIKKKIAHLHLVMSNGQRMIFKVNIILTNALLGAIVIFAVYKAFIHRPDSIGDFAGVNIMLYFIAAFFYSLVTPLQIGIIARWVHHVTID